MVTLRKEGTLRSLSIAEFGRRIATKESSFSVKLHLQRTQSGLRVGDTDVDLRPVIRAHLALSPTHRNRVATGRAREQSASVIAVHT